MKSSRDSWSPFALGIGSNIGPRREHMQAALAALKGLPGIELTGVSSWIESVPEGGPAGQGLYLNGAVCGRTRLSPRALLEVLLAIEVARGRVRQAGQRNGPRTLDLDLLLFDQHVIQEHDLVVPHPRLCLRAFVLAPLAEIAPDLRVPPDGKSVAEHLAALDPRTSAAAGVRP